MKKQPANSARKQQQQQCTIRYLFVWSRCSSNSAVYLADFSLSRQTNRYPVWRFLPGRVDDRKDDKERTLEASFFFEIGRVAILSIEFERKKCRAQRRIGGQSHWWLPDVEIISYRVFHHFTPQAVTGGVDESFNHQYSPQMCSRNPGRSVPRHPTWG